MLLAQPAGLYAQRIGVLESLGGPGQMRVEHTHCMCTGVC